MTATTQIMTEAATCRELVTPKLTGAGWESARTTSCATGDFPLAVVKAKELGRLAESGVRQAS